MSKGLNGQVVSIVSPNRIVISHEGCPIIIDDREVTCEGGGADLTGFEEKGFIRKYKLAKAICDICGCGIDAAITTQLVQEYEQKIVDAGSY